MHPHNGFNKSSRWAEIYNNYEEYAVTGFKIQWYPSLHSDIPLLENQTDPNVKAQQIRFIETWNSVNDGIDILDATDNKRVMSSGYKILNPYRPFKKYFRLKKISQQQQCKWQKCSAALPTTPTPNLLTDAATAFSIYI